MLENTSISRDQSCSDFARKNSNVPKQMLTAFTTAEYLRQEDSVFNDAGFEIADILSSVARLGLTEDDRIKAISAEEY